MEDFKIAVIGGPKGGKSDFMKAIRRNLGRGRENGEFKCIMVPETAREFMKDVAKFDETTKHFYQTCIFNRQLFKEREAKEVSLNLKDNKARVVTICDRGIMDNKAYLDDDEYFRKMARKAGTSEIELLDDYNLILYFVSSAKMEDSTIYEEGQDEIRDESKELANTLDDKTIKAWLGHRNIIIIQPEKDFNVKLSKAVLAVKKQLKFGRVDYPKYDISNYDTSLYETGEFPTIQETIYRFPKLLMADYLSGIVKRTYNGEDSYIKFTKCDKGKYGYVTETEKPITRTEAKKLLKQRGCYPGPQFQEVTYVYEDNTIYRIVKEDNNQYYEIMSGENKPPKLLIEKQQENDLPKLKIKGFKKK